MISLDLSYLEDQTEDLNDLKGQLEKYVRNLKDSPHPFMNLPFKPFEIERMKDLKRDLEGRTIKNLVVLGIGGSSLGTSAIFNALLSPLHNIDERTRKGKPRYFILDNIDPHTIKDVMAYLQADMEETLFVVVSKSGETSETLSQFMIFKDICMAKGIKERITVITGEKGGILKKIAEREGYNLLHIPDDVPGRYSVLTPCALFPSLVMDIDIEEILRGSKEMAIHINSKAQAENLSIEIASRIYALLEKGRKIFVLMPYCDRLSFFSDWLIQLFSESLGKAGKGFTSLKGKGVTDQHSLLQLLVDGPKDKAIIFFYVETKDTQIADTFPYVEEIDYLRGKTLTRLFSAEFSATRLSLKEANVPSITISASALTPYVLGAYFFLFEMVTVLLGYLFDVNPFTQEGVEKGKIYTRALLGKNGFDEERKRIENKMSKAKLLEF